MEMLLTLERETVTDLLCRWSSGQDGAFDELMEQVYGELRSIAERCFRRERAEHTLQATAIVHEAVLRLIDFNELEWQDRAHFYAVTARMMRRILVDHARERGRLKRGGKVERVTLAEAESVAKKGRNPDLESLDEALDKLESRDPRKARIVELRFFVGLTSGEIAHCLGISIPTVTREWRRARTWLYGELQGVRLDE